MGTCASRKHTKNTVGFEKNGSGKPQEHIVPTTAENNDPNKTPPNHQVAVNSHERQELRLRMQQQQREKREREETERKQRQQQRERQEAKRCVRGQFSRYEEPDNDYGLLKRKKVQIGVE